MRQVKRRWRDAKLALAESFGGDMTILNSPKCGLMSTDEEDEILESLLDRWEDAMEVGQPIDIPDLCGTSRIGNVAACQN
ncbi:MAG: hypothetical protein R3C28_03035 [Pirellulaceae bacterium]